MCKLAFYEKEENVAEISLKPRHRILNTFSRKLLYVDREDAFCVSWASVKALIVC